MKSWKDWFSLPSFTFDRLKSMSKAQAEAYHCFATRRFHQIAGGGNHQDPSGQR